MQPFHELAAEDYAQLDIGAVNLACAEGLRGSEDIDSDRYLAVLDHWAGLVAEKTERVWSQFAKNPEQYENSAAYFCMLVLVTVLQRDLGVFYAKNTLEENYDATDSRLHFLHGILEGRGGTCATMPVLYAAIGRRLGYPLKLVQAVQHLFVRWDDPESGERFNIEATSEGLNVQPDEHYLTWPQPVIPEHLEAGWVVRSMSPLEELAVFYEARGACFLDWLDFRQAFELASHATRISGGREKSCRSWFLGTIEVLYRASIGSVTYSLQDAGGWGVVIEEGRERPMHASERAAVIRAEHDLDRLDKLHAARRLAGLPYVEVPPILQFAGQPLAAAGFCYEEIATCTTLQ